MRMTKDMYESLQVKDLKEIAASRGLSLPARVKKEDIVGKLLELDRAEDEKVLKEREAARAQREGAGEREHSAPARRGRKPGARKEEGKEGRKEGIKESKLDTARLMLANGEDISKIMCYTGLTESEINNLS